MSPRSAKGVKGEDELPPEEAARRRDEVVKRMLNTPPQPRRSGKIGKTGPQDGGAEPAHFYVFLDEGVFVAAGETPPGPVFTTDLYRNLDDLRAGRVSEPGVTLEVDAG